MEQNVDYASLYEYLGRRAGMELGQQVYQEAKKRYPIGIKTNNIYTDAIGIISEHETQYLNKSRRDELWKDGKQIWFKTVAGTNVCIYQNGKWAEIVESPKQEKWIPKIDEWIVRTKEGTKANCVTLGKVYKTIDVDKNSVRIIDDNGNSSFFDLPNFRKALDHEIPKENVINGGSYTGLNYYDDISGFVLPEKWCVLVNVNNEDIINAFYDKNCNTTCYKQLKGYYLNNYVHSCNLSSGNSLFSNNPGSNFHKKTIENGFIEITFEQFQKYVLKEDNSYHNVYSEGPSYTITLPVNTNKHKEVFNRKEYQK